MGIRRFSDILISYPQQPVQPSSDRIGVSESHNCGIRVILSWDQSHWGHWIRFKNKCFAHTWKPV